MSRVRVVASSLALAVVLISIIGLSLSAWFWSFVSLLAVGISYFGIEFLLLKGGIGEDK